jgi:hypothetical protein
MSTHFTEKTAESMAFTIALPTCECHKSEYFHQFHINLPTGVARLSAPSERHERFPPLVEIGLLLFLLPWPSHTAWQMAGDVISWQRQPARN